MNIVTRKLVTIVTESALEQKLKREIERLGAKGYTIVNARGSGHQGSRDGNWGEASTNIRIEIVCSDAVALAIAEHCDQRYAEDFAMIVYLSDVQVAGDHDQGED